MKEHGAATQPEARSSRLIDDLEFRHRGNPNFGEHDEFGFRSSRDIGISEVLLTGSSHVYGINLGVEDSWPYRLQSQGMPIYSAAMGAWSTLQYALVSRDWLRPHHKVFLVCIYLGFDVYATLKHSVATSSAFSRQFVDYAAVPGEPSWRWRDEQMEEMETRRAEGETDQQILLDAWDRGHPIADQVFVGGKAQWLETRLRTATMDLSRPYILAAYNLCLSYMRYIRIRCAATGTKFVCALLPTKEYALASSADGPLDAPLQSFLSVENRLACSLISDLGMICDAVFDLTPLDILHREQNCLFDVRPLEGHPSVAGARVLADAVSAIIRRFC